jgi:23S rRNA (guanosine2251-2'-O)-methyltransferase
MKKESLIIYQCTNLDCDLRFSLSEKEKKPKDCPKCGHPFQTTIYPFEAEMPAKKPNTPKTTPIEIVLDNIRSTLNVGSIFRTADGAGIDKIHLCGITPTPDHPKMLKTGLGAEWMVPWEYHPNSLSFIKQQQRSGISLVCLEMDSKAKSIFTKRIRFHKSPTLLVIGNEITGVDPEICKISDEIYYLPMAGYKRSLNVSVAFGIFIYHWIYVE